MFSFCNFRRHFNLLGPVSDRHYNSVVCLCFTVDMITTITTLPAPFFLSKNPFSFRFYYVLVSFWFRFGFVSFFSV